MEKNFLLFEDQIQDFITVDTASALELSARRTKFGDTSLKWSIGQEGTMRISTDIGYRAFDGNPSDQRRSSFVMWLYNECPSKEKLTLEFLEQGKVATHFEFGLDFKGWRCAWVMYDRDMKGTPTEQMDQLVIRAPKSMEGKDLYFTNIILSTPLDARHHMRDEQLPFVNLDADQRSNSHWMSVYAFYEAYKKFNLTGQVAKEQLEDLEIIHERYQEYLCERREVVDFKHLKAKYISCEIRVEEGEIKGRSIDYQASFVTLNAFDKTKYLEKINSIQAKEYFKVMYDLAIFLYKAEDKTHQGEVKEMFVRMFWHLWDQGFAKGSNAGTLHHLGYEMLQYYPAVYLMKDVLKKAGWMEEAMGAMNWFSGMGRIFYEELEAEGINMDVINTLIEGMFASVLMVDDTVLQSELLGAFNKWLTFACSPKSGLKGPFKYDGLGFHHQGFYPAYARDGLNGVTPIIYLIHGTCYGLPKEQHELVKQAVLNFRIFSNRNQFLLSVSGRHPKGTEALSLTPFKYMTLAGSPDRQQEVDHQVAAAYLRLTEGEQDSFADKLKGMGIQSEKAPVGNWSMNYAALSLHRRGEWLVGVKGHSKYVWANESYLDANLYGRYISHGQIQVMNQGSPVSNKESGYFQQGWDWNSWPGTTTIHLPIEKVKSDVRNVDTFSGFEEMLFSDESYAGAVDLEGRQGMFAMKLHEHPKYNGSHRARKSVFMFENRILALGSDIENNDSQYPTRTTLFQSYLRKSDEPIYIGGDQEITGLGYKESFTLESTTYLMDNHNIGYILPAGHKVTVTREYQQSRDQHDDGVTYGEFAKAVIEHGYAPQDAGYEYLMLIDTSLEALHSLKENSPYTILQKNSKAHIVKDHETGILAYALFEANEKINKGQIVGIDTPALVMTEEKEDEFLISISDPDLRLYEGRDESQYDERGIQKEVSVYSREWRGNPSQMHTLQLTLVGEWELAHENNKCRVLSRGDGNTVLAVDTVEGAKVEIRLK
ncbi:MAG: chondroitinase family polysaccharide lyase [Cellulosilyticaceae bacterium]